MCVCVYNVVFYETRNDERFSLSLCCCNLSSREREREKEKMCVLWAKKEKIIFFFVRVSEKED